MGSLDKISISCMRDIQVALHTWPWRPKTLWGIFEVHFKWLYKRDHLRILYRPLQRLKLKSHNLPQCLGFCRKLYLVQKIKNVCDPLRGLWHIFIVSSFPSNSKIILIKKISYLPYWPSFTKLNHKTYFLISVTRNKSRYKK